MSVYESVRLIIIQNSNKYQLSSPRSPLLQYLGHISNALYLVHDPVIKYYILQSMMDQESPLTILAGGVTSLALAAIITRLIETPARKYWDNNISHHRKGIITT